MPEPRELLRFPVVGSAAYGVTLLGDYSLKLTVLREKPVTALGYRRGCSRRQRHQSESPRVTKPSLS